MLHTCHLTWRRHRHHLSLDLQHLHCVVTSHVAVSWIPSATICSIHQHCNAGMLCPSVCGERVYIALYHHCIATTPLPSLSLGQDFPSMAHMLLHKHGHEMATRSWQVSTFSNRLGKSIKPLCKLPKILYPLWCNFFGDHTCEAPPDLLLQTLQKQRPIFHGSAINQLSAILTVVYLCTWILT